MQQDKLWSTGLSVLAILILLTSAFAFALPVTVTEQYGDSWDFPRLDELWMIEGYPDDVGLEKAKSCDIDNFVGAIDPDSVRDLRDNYGWNVSMSPGFHMCYLGINCRDYCIDTAGSMWPYHGRLEGFPLYPLNISQFRLALEEIVGPKKTGWVASIYEFVNVRLDTNIPPASAYWYNPYIEPYMGGWDKAELILHEAGFQGDAGVDNWLMPNGQRLRDRVSNGAGDEYCIYVMPPGDELAPTSHQISRLHTIEWNEFFTGMAIDNAGDLTNPDDGAIFQDEPMSVFDPLILVTFYDRTHDIYMLCWGLGRNPDYLWDFFHPDADVFGAANSPGLIHTGLGRILNTIMYWKLVDYEVLVKNIGEEPDILISASTTFEIPPPEAPIASVQIERCDQLKGVYDEELILGTDYEMTGPMTIHILKDIHLFIGDALEVKFEAGTHHRMITDIDEMRNLVWLAQWKLYYLCPYLPIYSRNYINLFQGGDTDLQPCAPGMLEGWVESLGYGSCPDTTVMPWTFGNIHWKDQPVGGSMKWHISGDVGTINPITASWVYEVFIANRVYDSLYVVNPETHADMPWAATHWELEEYIADDVPNGMKIKIWLRDDLYWQDGKHVTAEDVKWNFDFINSTRAPEMYLVWEDYLGTEVIHDYLAVVTVNATGMWRAYSYLGSALTFPQIVWEPFWGSTPTDTDPVLGLPGDWDPWTHPYKDWTGEDPPADKPGLTCMFGTGPFWLDYWNEIDTAHFYKNQEYWVRKAAGGFGQLGSLRVKGQCYKEYEDRKIPVCCGIEVHVLNLQCSPCTFEYEVRIDGVAIASGNDTDLACYAEYVDQPTISHTPDIFEHTFELYIRKYYTATGWTDWQLVDDIYAAFLIADTNFDCIVDGMDQYMLSKHWLGEDLVPPTVPAYNIMVDFNLDSINDGSDQWAMSQNWLKEC